MPRSPVISDYSQEFPEYGCRTKVDHHNGPKWTKMDHFGLADAQIQFGIRALDQNGRLDHFGPLWSSALSDSTAAIPYIQPASDL